LLRGLEQARRSTLADHVHRPSQLGPWVLINESWYYVDDTVITRWERLTQQQARLASGQSFDDVKSERSAN
jgi:hypothetical protein